MVRVPSVCAALAIASLVGWTRTQNSAPTSTRIRSLVISAASLARRTSSLRVFMLTGMIS